MIFRKIADTERFTLNFEELELANRVDTDIFDNAARNPYRAKDGKFTTGPSTSTTKTGLMTRKEADEATKDSKYKDVLYHGTSSSAADSISNEGFEIGKSTIGRQNGNAVYLTTDSSIAKDYAKMADKVSGRVISVKIDTKNPYVDTKVGDFSDGAFEYGKSNGIIKKSAKDIDDMPLKTWHKATSAYSTELLKKYDSLQIKSYFGDSVIVVKDPSQIKTFKVEDM